jgi:hypothetical protein
MKYLSLGVVLLASSAAITAQTPADKANDKIAKEPITLTGCVEAGTAPNTFVLTHVVKNDSSTMAQSPVPQPSVANPTATPPIAPPTEQPPVTPAPAPGARPAPTGTSGVESSSAAAIYWLDPPDKLKAHVGHKVSVVGTLDNDMDKAKITEKDDKVKVEAERGSRQVEAKPGSAAAADTKATKTGDKQESYKVKVTTITMISGTCS